jgi:hypothetical protein
MRGLRSFLLLLLVGVPIIGYAVYEYKREPVDADKKDKVFTGVASDQIEELTIKSEHGEQTTVKKNGTDWQIAAPVTAPGDGGEISGITSGLANLEQQRLIDENPADLAEYGLAQPRIEIAFKSGGQERRLQIGRKTPPGTDLYAKLANEKKVFLISSYLEGTFNKKTFDLRDKAVLKLERDKIDKLEIATPQRTLQFTKADGEWSLAAPVKARGDFTTIDGLVSRLNTLQMKSIVTEDPARLAEYGVDKPQATVTIGSGSSQAVLIIGKTGEEGVVYAKDQSRPAVITIEKSMLDDLTKDPAEYRQKDLFDARAFNSSRIDIVRGADTFAFEKTRSKNKDGQDEEKWKQVAPTARDVDQTKVENLVSAVTGARATGFVDSTAKTGLDKPELTVSIKFDGGKREEKASFARSGADGFATRAGEPGAAKVDIAAIENIVTSLEALK